MAQPAGELMSDFQTVFIGFLNLLEFWITRPCQCYPSRKVSAVFINCWYLVHQQILVRYLFGADRVWLSGLINKLFNFSLEQTIELARTIIIKQPKGFSCERHPWSTAVFGAQIIIVVEMSLSVSNSCTFHSFKGNCKRAGNERVIKIWWGWKFFNKFWDIFVYNQFVFIFTQQTSKIAK